MSLITKDHLSLTIQTIKNLINRVEARFLDENDAVELAAELELVSPTAADDGSIYTDENGVLYTL